MGGPRDPAQLLAPQVRGRVEHRIVEHWEVTGWTVHRIGQAVYIHRDDDQLHLIFGAWDRREPPPAWADRLGRPSPGYQRRSLRAWSAESWRRMLRRPDGRFWIRLPWWKWPEPRAYRWGAR